MTTPEAVAEVHPHDEPRSYPLMLRTRDYAWWRPLVGLLMLVVGLFVAQAVLLPVLAVAVAVDHDGAFSDAYSEIASQDVVTWQSMLYLNLSLAALAPVACVVLLMVHHLRAPWLGSVRPGIRRDFLRVCFGLAAIALIVSVLVGFLLPDDPLGVDTGSNSVTSSTISLGIVILLTTPLQAIGEEYAFRGYLLQSIGSLAGRVWVGIVGSSLLFAAAHGYQNLPLFIDRFAFGLMAAYVVYRTGGLEAGIALHILNNLVAFGLALGFGDIDDTLNITEVSWWNLPLTLTLNGVFLALVLRSARRRGVRSTTDPSPAPLATS